MSEQPYVIPRHWLDRAESGGQSLETTAILAGWQAARQAGMQQAEVSDAIVIAALDAVLATLRQAGAPKVEAGGSNP
ncbi:hypothetical protein [Nocardia sp. NPDC051463]|uniref:hypothetical protein n=1 Tax=Nocardia sp. NPDC051463 TaxID=3154845 RepID=UPI00344F09EA